MSHTEEYKGYTINIKQDTYPENPFNDWDYEPPLAVYSDRWITEYATQYGNVNSVPYLTREQIQANLAEILDILDLSSPFALREYDNLCLVDSINDQLANTIDNLDHSERLDALCSLYNAAGIPAVCSSVRGYCQGDYVEVLAVATPEFQKACGNGADYDWIGSLEQSVKLFGYWAFGDVYGYTIDELDDSCWGYYGDYPEYGGAIQAAKSAIDWHIENEQKERIKQVKTWIRNRVPLTHRIA